MMNGLANLADKLRHSPKRIFLIDASGAILSALFLGIILPVFQIYIGIPRATLYILAVFPLIFAAFDLYAYYFTPSDSPRCLRIITGANLLYCILTFSLVMYYYKQIMPLGIIYFSAEIIVIILLVYIEVRILKNGHR